MNHRRPVCIIFFLFLGMFVPTVFAGGQREGDSLVQAEALIEEKKYRQAISLLVQEARANPQRLEEIQRHLRKIWRIQERAKERYAELRAAYEEDPHRANELIKELKEWDPYPIDQSRRILAAAGDIIGFTHNRERWKGIMAAAQVQLNQGLYWKAVLTYLGGFDLSRDSFDEAGFKESEINLVDSRTAAVVDILGGFCPG